MLYVFLKVHNKIKKKELSMKKKSFTKKLTLGKATVSNIQPDELNKVRGGMTYTCPGLNCPKTP
jgi:hypothetical protein